LSQLPTSVKCSKCGYDNWSSSKYCQQCGNPLTPTIQPAPSSPLQIPVFTGKFSPTPLDNDRARLTPEGKRSLNRTWAGLGLLLVGIILQPIPVIAVYAGAAIVVGVLLVFYGRRSLGGKHRGYATAALVLVVIGQAAVFAGSLAVGAIIGIDVASGTADPASALSSLFLGFYIIIVITDAVTNVGLVLITYDLQDSTGRTLLWSAFSLEIMINVVIASIVVLTVQANATQVLGNTGSFTDAVRALQASFVALRLLLWIPAIPYAIAYYRARSQVDRRAIAADRTSTTVGPSQ